MAVDSAALASSDGADCDTKRIQPATAAKSAPPTAAAMSKPKWAMTEDEADNVEEAEAADLVNFASSLNYDSFIDDLEVRQALCIIRDRIEQEKSIQATAEADEEAEAERITRDDWQDEFVNSWNNEKANSEAGTERSNRDTVAVAAPAEGAKENWDSSTTGGEGKAVPTEARRAAEELLKSNPALAAKHSVRSLVAATTTAKHDPPRLSLAERMASLPPPRIVTIIENPRVPLDGKSFDPSNLPYLHRNPAI